MKVSKTIRCLGAAMAASLLAACSTAPRVEAQWVDPGVGPNSALLRGARVLVACDAYDFAIRQICQDGLVAQLTQRGSLPTAAAAGVPLPGDRPPEDQLFAGARAIGVKTVLIVTVTPAVTDVSSGLSLGIGGFGFGRNSALGVGLAAPIGGGQVSTGFAANGRVTDATTGRVLWTATATAPPSSDVNLQIDALSRTLLQSAQTAGLF